jgi:hypothetical protein
VAVTVTFKTPDPAGKPPSFTDEIRVQVTPTKPGAPLVQFVILDENDAFKHQQMANHDGTNQDQRFEKKVDKLHLKKGHMYMICALVKVIDAGKVVESGGRAIWAKYG